MALTQKLVKEQIAEAEKMIEETVSERNELRKRIQGSLVEDNRIDNSKMSDETKELVDEYNGLLATIQFYTGHLNALEWALKEMKAKTKSKK